MATQEILFPNGHTAQLTTLPSGAPAASALQALKLPPAQAVILLLGSATEFEDAALVPRLLQLLSRGLIRAAGRLGAIILDGGAHCGVMALLGEAAGEGGRQIPLLGVAPAGKVTFPGDGVAAEEAPARIPLNPKHSHFVLVESADWNDASEARFAIADSLAHPHTPVLVFLANGGPEILPEVLCCVRRGWPLMILSGSGGLADELLQARSAPPESITDPVMAEILADGHLTFFPLNGLVGQFQDLVERPLSLDPTLKLAWERQKMYSTAANKKQLLFKRIQKLVLGLGVFATILALVKGLDFFQNKIGYQIQLPFLNLTTNLAEIFHVLLIFIPITTAAMLAMGNRFKWGPQWIALRNASEAVKREFYRYWTGTGVYRQAEAGQTSRQSQLAQRLETINNQLLQTEVNLTALSPTGERFPFDFAAMGTGPDGYRLLSPEQYLTLRLESQLKYYRGKAVPLEKNLKWLYRLIYLFGGLGTLLAAIGRGLEVWVAVTTAVVTAFTAYLGLMQVENTLKKYNQAAAGLEDAKLKWTALNAAERSDPQHVDQLVEETEMMLQGEHSEWVQQMKDALADLEKKHLEEQPEPEPQPGGSQAAKPPQEGKPPEMPQPKPPAVG